MKNRSLFQCCLALLLSFCAFTIKAQSIIQLQQGKPTSIRGLSVVNDSVAWISGSRGYIAITQNGGKDWAWQKVKGFEKADFRDIEAFSGKEAVIMSSGTPALVLKTTDGGKSWQVKYSNADTTFFFDAMDFADHKHGYILGDPISNKFLLMETKDGGDTWVRFKDQPDAIKDEAAFAASGTCLRVVGNNIYIASGGSNARLISFSTNSGWTYEDLPIIHGKSSQGAFSLAMGTKEEVLIGGDYVKDKNTDSISVVRVLGTGAITKNTSKGPSGFQSCVEFITDHTYLSTGTPGSNISIDGGKTWIKIDDTSYNVCRKAKHGKLIILAGNGGKIGVLKM